MEATNLEKLEVTRRTELTQGQKGRCVEKCGAKTLERLELVRDVELPSRQSAELATDSELE